MRKESNFNRIWRLLMITCLVAAITIPVAKALADNQVKVTMKNGTVLTGEMVKFDPQSQITLRIGGQETSVKMSDVQSIENTESKSQPAVSAKTGHNPAATAKPADKNSAKQAKSNNNKKKKDKKAGRNIVTIDNPALAPADVAEVVAALGQDYDSYIVTDTKQYPDSFKINVGGQQLNMRLVRGGVYNMGYDGSPEDPMYKTCLPVHPVKVSSFYVSDSQLLNSTASKLLNKELKNPARRFTGNHKTATAIAKAAAEQSGKALRLPTEAEWEYIAKQPVAEEIFTDDPDSHNWYRISWETVRNSDWCSDILEPFKASGLKVNPKGGKSGSKHAIRTYPDFESKRKYSRTLLDGCNGSMRLVISADELGVL